MTNWARSKSLVLSTIRDVGIIPVIRAQSAEAAQEVVEALAEAGLAIAEITMTVPGAIDAIASVKKLFGDKVLVGAGTVTNAETAQRVMDAGAEFIVTPCLVPEVIETARRENILAMSGALTPTEIFNAVENGSDMVKVFPVQSVGGATYLRSLRGPFPEVPLIPTGGVTLDNIHEMFAAGAAAVGVGSELISKDSLARRDHKAIRALTTQFLAATRMART